MHKPMAPKPRKAILGRESVEAMVVFERRCVYSSSEKSAVRLKVRKYQERQKMINGKGGRKLLSSLRTVKSSTREGWDALVKDFTAQASSAISGCL